MWLSGKLGQTRSWIRTVTKRYPSGMTFDVARTQNPRKQTVTMYTFISPEPLFTAPDWYSSSVLSANHLTLLESAILVITRLVGCWRIYILATSEVIWGWVPTCDRAHSWRFYSAPSLGNHVTSANMWYPIQSPYPDTELTSPFPIQLMPSTKLGSDEFTFYASLVYLDQDPNSQSSKREACVLQIRSLYRVVENIKPKIRLPDL